MKKNFLLMIALLCFAMPCKYTFAQLPVGVLAPAFSMVDINGNTQVLYNYTNAGKAVIIDVSAVWCGPCWSYHQSGALETAYNSWGPTGTNELMVLWIEGDQNPLPCLQGSGCSTQGNWTTGTSFPMMLTVSPNNSSVVSNYDINYFPTIYVVCPDRVIREVGQLSASSLRTACQACTPVSATVNDSKVFEILTPSTSTCSSSITPKVKIQNYGSGNLTSLVLTSKVDGIVKGTKNWSGNLSRFESIDVTMPIISGIADGYHIYSVETSLPNGVADENTANDIKTSSFGVYTSGVNAIVKVVTDGYPAQVSWNIVEQGTSNIIVERASLKSGTNNLYICLDYDCYTFNIYDAGNNGMLSPAYAQVIVLGNTLVDIPGTSYTSSKSVDFCISQSNIGEEQAISTLSVYPNPFTSATQIHVNLSESQDVTINVYNMMGECVYHIADDNMATGEHTFDLNGENLSNGLYVVRMNVGTKVLTKRIELTR